MYDLTLVDAEYQIVVVICARTSLKKNRILKPTIEVKYYFVREKHDNKLVAERDSTSKLDTNRIKTL